MTEPHMGNEAGCSLFVWLPIFENVGQMLADIISVEREFGIVRAGEGRQLEGLCDTVERYIGRSHYMLEYTLTNPNLPAALKERLEEIRQMYVPDFPAIRFFSEPAVSGCLADGHAVEEEEPFHY